MMKKKKNNLETRLRWRKIKFKNKKQTINKSTNKWYILITFKVIKSKRK